jgi:CheY-like chemotaxis protein
MSAHVLVVDDNAINCKLVTFLLSAHGYDVRSAPDAHSALDAIREQKPSLILMDLQLPDIDGLELTRRLKADPETHQISILAVTAFAMKGDHERALEAGCDGYIAKPIDTQVLPDMVKDYLEGRR